MYKAHIVEVLEPFGHFDEVSPALFQGHHLAGGLVCLDFGEKRGFVLLVDHVQPAALFEVVVKGDYVRMVQLIHD